MHGTEQLDTGSSNASLASRSTTVLPWTPTWLGIHAKVTHSPIATRPLKISTSFKMKGLRASQLNCQEARKRIQKMQRTSKQEELHQSLYRRSVTDLQSENSRRRHSIPISWTISTHCRAFRRYRSYFSKTLPNQLRVRFRLVLCKFKTKDRSWIQPWRALRNHNRCHVIQIYIRTLKVWFHSESKRLNCIGLLIANILI